MKYFGLFSAHIEKKLKEINKQTGILRLGEKVSSLCCFYSYFTILKFHTKLYQDLSDIFHILTSEVTGDVILVLCDHIVSKTSQ